VRRGVLGRLDERGLKVVLAVFFLALAIPSVVLVAQAYSQLKWGAFRSTQLAAEELATRIDATLRAAIAAEDARSFGDYSFLVVKGDAAANFVQGSPLSSFPVASALPGVLGYFQIDAAGKLTTPLLPDAGVAASSYGIGADDYIAKPFSIAQLVLRVKAVLRRSRLGAEQAANITLVGVEIDTRNLSGQRGSEPLTFTRREIEILQYLHAHAERPVSRDELLTRVWGYDRTAEIETRTVDIHIAKLRRKIETDAKEPRHLLTVRGAGYRLVVGT